MQCPNCSQDVIQESVFCPHCGTRIAEAATEETPQRRFQEAVKNRSEATDDPPQRELWQGSYSKLAMVGHWVLAGIASVALLILAVVAEFNGTYWLVVVGVILLGWLALLAKLLYLQFSRHYYLTNRQITHEKGLLWRETDRIEAIDVDDVSYVQGPLERFLGVGTVRITSSDRTHPVLELPGIENVREVANLIDEARRDERRRRGLHIESV